MSEALYYTTHDSFIGRLILVASNRGLRALNLLREGQDANAFLNEHFSEPPSAPLVELRGFFDSACKALDDYLENGTELTLPFDLVGGTPLQRVVWLELLKIPYGKTISYSELAARVGFPRAVRAVASACGANPIALLVPCHRVLAKDGTLGGYSMGGIGIKERLLALESQSLLAVA